MRNLNKQEEKSKPVETFLDEMLSAVQDNNVSIEPEDEYIRQDIQSLDFRRVARPEDRHSTGRGSTRDKPVRGGLRR